MLLPHLVASRSRDAAAFRRAHVLAGENGLGRPEGDGRQGGRIELADLLVPQDKRRKQWFRLLLKVIHPAAVAISAEGSRHPVRRRDRDGSTAFTDADSRLALKGDDGLKPLRQDVFPCQRGSAAENAGPAVRLGGSHGA